MLGRQDYENIYVMFSDHPHFWHATQMVLKPTFPWGNSSSWAIAAHRSNGGRLARAQPRGGPMRKYCIGAFLLDWTIRQSHRRLREPLLNRMRASVRVTCLTSFIPAAVSCTAGNSSSPTPRPITPQPSPRCRSTTSWRRWNSAQAYVQARVIRSNELALSAVRFEEVLSLRPLTKLRVHVRVCAY